MVEALVAMLISGIVAFALVDMATSSMRFMGRAGADAQAYELIEELTELTRASGFKRLITFKDQINTLTLNGVEGVQYSNPDFHDRPVLFDFLQKQWTSKTFANKFEGELTYYVFDGPDPGSSLNVAIDLTWQDKQTRASRSLGRVIVLVDPENNL